MNHQHFPSIHIHDCTNIDVMNSTLDLLDKINTKIDGGKTITFIDNSNLLVANNKSNIFALTRLVIEARKKRNVSTLIALCHEDAMNKSDRNQIRYVFQTIITVDILTLKQNFEYNLSVVHKSAIGKLSRTKEELCVSNELVIKKISIIKKANEENSLTDKNDDDNGLENLTFNLNLNENDLETKRNLILPYELINKPSRQETEVKPNENNQNGLILYQPDERDDVDEEDPDDDLNF